MTVAERLHALKQKIAECSSSEIGANQSVELLAVSKYASPKKIQEAYEAGQRLFAESKVQPAIGKMLILPKDIEWHFIGPIQSNKTKQIAQIFSWVHSLDRIKIAERLNDSLIGTDKKLNICIQINITEESQKRGIRLEEVDTFVEQLKLMDNLVLRGLMAMGRKNATENEQLNIFRKVYTCFNQLTKQTSVDTLSMGMSNDFPLAIASGATMIRVGSAIFNE